MSNMEMPGQFLRKLFDAAASRATAAGDTPLNLGGRIEGEARHVAEIHATLALKGASGILVLAYATIPMVLTGWGRVQGQS